MYPNAIIDWASAQVEVFRTVIIFTSLVLYGALEVWQQSCTEQIFALCQRVAKCANGVRLPLSEVFFGSDSTDHIARARDPSQLLTQALTFWA